MVIDSGISAPGGLGAWDLLRGLFKKPEDQSLSARQGLQLVNEAALCENRIRPRITLCNQGFALANGLSYLATDETVHEILDHHNIEEYEELQITLRCLRQLQGHYHPQNILVLDPHRIVSATQRTLPSRKRGLPNLPIKCCRPLFATMP